MIDFNALFEVSRDNSVSQAEGYIPTVFPNVHFYFFLMSFHVFLSLFWLSC